MHIISRFFTSLAAVCLIATAQAQTWKPTIDPNLSESNWATQGATQSARLTEPSGLTISHIDANRGLFAVYKSTSGVRVMFSSQYVGRELMSATVKVQSGAAGQVSTVLATRRPTRNTEGVVTVQGVDVVAALAAHKAGKRGGPSVKALKDFAASDTGAAVFEGVAALYLQLSELEHSPRIAALKSPFGLMRTTVEALSGVNGGIDAIDVLASPTAIGAARGSCTGKGCQLRGREFVLHDSGFFDVVSGQRMKSDAAPICAPNPIQRTSFRGDRGSFVKVQSSGGVDLTDLNCQALPTAANGCHGVCGAGCTGDVRAAECCGHDRCVAIFGHLACLFEVPAGCPSCDTLMNSMAAWWRIRMVTIEQ